MTYATINSLTSVSTLTSHLKNENFWIGTSCVTVGPLLLGEQIGDETLGGAGILKSAGETSSRLGSVSWGLVDGRFFLGARFDGLPLAGTACCCCCWCGCWGISAPVLAATCCWLWWLWWLWWRCLLALLVVLFIVDVDCCLAVKPPLAGEPLRLLVSCSIGLDILALFSWLCFSAPDVSSVIADMWAGRRLLAGTLMLGIVFSVFIFRYYRVKIVFILLVIFHSFLLVSLDLFITMSRFILWRF